MISQTKSNDDCFYSPPRSTIFSFLCGNSCCHVEQTGDTSCSSSIGGSGRRTHWLSRFCFIDDMPRSSGNISMTTPTSTMAVGMQSVVLGSIILRHGRAGRVLVAIIFSIRLCDDIVGRGRRRRGVDVEVTTSHLIHHGQHRRWSYGLQWASSYFLEAKNGCATMVNETVGSRKGVGQKVIPEDTWAW